MKKYTEPHMHGKVQFISQFIPGKTTSLAIIFALVTTFLNAQPVGQVTQGLSTLENGLWPNKTCNVCWENPAAANATQRLWVQDAVNSTWEKESEFRFTGWGTCTANSRGIRILIANEWPRAKGLGTKLDGMRDGVVLNFNWSECPADGTSEECIKKVAVHEFGHALGFAHEQNRKDAPAACQNDAQGSTGDWWVTPYDANSIMNYCNPKWNNNGLLSDLDKQGIRLLYGGGGYVLDPIFYGTDASYNLKWYKHTGHWNGTFEWASDGSQVGTGWKFRQVFSDGDGHVYYIADNGDLYWNNHIGLHDGTFRWSQNSSAIVGKGWNVGYRAAFAAGGGVIYLINDKGDLFWYKHLGYQNGSSTWDPASGTKIGNGWNDFHAVFSGGNGVIYLLDKNYDLFWYKHAGFATGVNSWYGGQSNKIANWKGKTVKQVFSTGWGHIYFIDAAGSLLYYNHMGFINGTGTWSKSSGNKVGTGWSGLQTIGMGSINPSFLSSAVTKEAKSDPNIRSRY
jgi:hypothetical protein